jgi:hypothetical protein
MWRDIAFLILGFLAGFTFAMWCLILIAHR